MTSFPLVNINIVTSSGGGKTTIARKLEQFFKDEGCNVAVKNDDYIANQGKLDLRNKFVAIETTQ